MLLIATCCCASRRVPLGNTGSAKAIIGFVADDVADAVRKILRLATDGRIVTAYERTSQSTSLNFLPLGSFVTSSCGGRLVSAPLVTTDSLVFDTILGANAPKVS